MGPVVRRMWSTNYVALGILAVAIGPACAQDLAGRQISKPLAAVAPAKPDARLQSRPTDHRQTGEGFEAARRWPQLLLFLLLAREAVDRKN